MKKQISSAIDEKLRKTLKDFCDKNGYKISYVIEEGIIMKMKELEKEVKNRCKE